MKKVLFLVNELESANGVCVQTIMNEMCNQNFQVFCITNKEKGDRSNFVRGKIIYFTVKSRLIHRVFSFCEKMNQKKISIKLLKINMIILNKIKLLITLPTWPLVSPLYTLRIYNKAIQVCKQNNVECIIPAYSQIDTLIASKMVKKKYKNIKYIPYFLDSLSGGYGPKIKSKTWVIKRGLKWEERLLSTADRIIMMQSSINHHKIYSSRKKYYDKIVYLDLPLLGSNVVNFEFDGKLMNEEKINIVYVGTLHSGIRSPEFFLKVFDYLNSKYEAYFIGESDCKILNEFTKQNSNIHIIGRCNRELALQYEKEATILLNIGNTNANMTPSKIFEYMSFNKPIISTYPIEDEPSIHYLNRYSKALLLDETINDFKKISEIIEEFVDLSLKSEEICDFSSFFHNTPQAFINVIRDI